MTPGKLGIWLETHEHEYRGEVDLFDFASPKIPKHDAPEPGVTSEFLQDGIRTHVELRVIQHFGACQLTRGQCITPHRYRYVAGKLRQKQRALGRAATTSDNKHLLIPIKGSIARGAEVNACPDESVLIRNAEPAIRRAGSQQYRLCSVSRRHWPV